MPSRRTPLEVPLGQENKDAEAIAVTRREFLQLTMAAPLAVGVGNNSWAAENNTGIPYRTLGHTGERVSMLGLGGFHLGRPNVEEQESVRIVRTAIDNGVNFLDNCWDYNEGTSEIRMGKALRDGYRQKAFLMTKIDGRSKESATRQLDESLKRFGVDHIDLVQHHEILRYEDPHRIFDPDGANAALVRARAAGKIRYIGFTGHKDPHIHLYMLEVADQNGFVFDTVQMPLN